MSVLSALWLAGCTAAGTQVANLPTYFDGISVRHDVAYGPLDEHKLDIYQSDPTPHHKNATIVFLYGGRWSSGSKSNYAFVGSTLAKAGYQVIIPDYRKYPDVKFPAFAEDVAKAVAWTAENNKNPVFILGHSSGAHLGALVATDSRYLAAEGKDPSVITAFAGLAGPYAFIPEEEDLKDMFGPPSRYPLMQAPAFASGNEPPMLLIWGEDDDIVGRFNHEKLQQAILNKNGCVTVKTYPAIDHVWTVGAFSWLGRKKSTIPQDVMTFFDNAAQNPCQK